MKNPSWVLVIGLAVVTAMAVSVAVKRITAQESAHVVPPYQIWLTETLMDKDNFVTEQYDLFKGQNSKGDSVHVELQERLRTIEFAAKGVVISYTPENNVILTRGTGVPRVAEWHGDHCQGYFGLTGETKVILGFQTFKVVSGALPTGLQTAWLAPVLNCEALEEQTRWTFNGAPDGVTTKVATRAIAGEPAPDLFVIPANATEVPPSVFWPPLGRSPDQREEEIYNTQKAKRGLLQSVGK